MATHFSILAWGIPWPEEPGATVHGVAKSQMQQTHSVYMSKLILQFIPLSPSPSTPTSLFPTFVRIF